MGEDALVAGLGIWFLEFDSSSPEHLSFPLNSKLAGRVEGRSKQARLGWTAHITAPIIHALRGCSHLMLDFRGLPVTVVYPTMP